MKIRVQSDGQITRIFDESGEQISGVQRVVFEHSTDKLLPTCTLEMLSAGQVDVVVDDVHIVKCPSDLGWALGRIRAGVLITRAAWRGQYVRQGGAPAFPGGPIVHVTASGAAPWAPTPEDLVASDYQIYEACPCDKCDCLREVGEMPLGK